MVNQVSETLDLAETEARIHRFDERVDQAMRQSPPSKVWVRNGLHRLGAPRCPVHLRRLSHDIILRHGDGLAELFVSHPDDMVLADAYHAALGFQAPGVTEPVNAVQVLTRAAEWTDEWGTRWGHAAGGVGASPIAHPLEDWSQLNEYLAHRMPDARSPGRLDGIAPALALHGSERYFAGLTNLVLWERFHCLRGMENAFADLYDFPKETDRLLGALTEYYLEIIRAWGRLANVDALFMTDDWGTQATLMISPEMWRRFFAPRYRRLFAEAHRVGIDVVFHSCGNVTEIIADLIDVGVDILDPLQPEAMDLQRVAREYGGKVTFCGAISDQLLAVQSPAQVRDEVRRTIDVLGAPYRNAYIVAPANALMPEVPLANLEALFDACHSQ